eukprot:COSAG01_NODE_5837_length_4003_cov_332.200390_6_plen_223_part_00
MNTSIYTLARRVHELEIAHTTRAHKPFSRRRLTEHGAVRQHPFLPGSEAGASHVIDMQPATVLISHPAIAAAAVCRSHPLSWRLTEICIHVQSVTPLLMAPTSAGQPLRAAWVGPAPATRPRVWRPDAPHCERRPTPPGVARRRCCPRLPCPSPTAPLARRHRGCGSGSESAAVARLRHHAHPQRHHMPRWMARAQPTARCVRARLRARARPSTGGGSEGAS